MRQNEHASRGIYSEIMVKWHKQKLSLQGQFKKVPAIFKT